MFCVPLAFVCWLMKGLLYLLTYLLTCLLAYLQPALEKVTETLDIARLRVQSFLRHFFGKRSKCISYFVAKIDRRSDKQVDRVFIALDG